MNRRRKTKRAGHPAHPAACGRGNRRIFRRCAGGLVPVVLLWAASAGAEAVDASTLRGKVMAGYQGWFTAAGHEGSTRWIHWTRDHALPTGAPGNLTVDMYPDLREFEADELFPTGMTLGGRPAFLYSASHPQTVRRHVRWMRDYGLDGVFVQRFVRSHSGGDAEYREHLDRVLRSVRAGCEEYGRVFAVMYDVSGMRDEEDWEGVLRSDWTRWVDEGLTDSGRYLRHRGRPVVGLWGFGFTDRVPADPRRALALIEWFRSGAPPEYRATLFGGVPGHWRTLSRDSRRDPGWAEVYAAFEAISPWTVGRYRNAAEVDAWQRSQILPDLQRARQVGADYAPVVWPGFSWRNLKGAQGNQISRDGGRFFWRQVRRALEAGAETLYIAMFDEVDEGTAIYKVAATRADAPDQGFWLTLDADGFDLPSDAYLRLAGAAGRLLRGEDPSAGDLPPPD